MHRAVPEDIADDYREACLVLADSPKASAASSRRILQRVLRDYGGATQGELNREIDHILPTLPSDTASALHAVHRMGNFASHPMKSADSGEILDVEPGEAEWSLDVLDLLFDFYFIQPALVKDTQAQLNAKLSGAGRRQITFDQPPD